MKEIGMDDWFIDVMMESYSIIRTGYASQTTTVVEQITGRKPIPLHNLPTIMHKPLIDIQITIPRRTKHNVTYKPGWTQYVFINK